MNFWNPTLVELSRSEASFASSNVEPAVIGEDENIKKSEKPKLESFTDARLL